jgi:hypothetical protein
MIETVHKHQNPSWEANRYSADQGILRLVWKPCPQDPTIGHYPEPNIRPNSRFYVIFRNMLVFCGEVLLEPRPTPSQWLHPV